MTTRDEDIRSLAAGEITDAEYRDRERRRLVENWPSTWGDDLHIVIYGDLRLPDRPIWYPEFEITLTTRSYGEGQTEPSALDLGIVAEVKLKSKTWDELQAAVPRINTWLGLIALQNLGNFGLRWWSFLTHLAGGGAMGVEWGQPALPLISARLESLSPDSRKHVERALYWIREARPRIRDDDRMSVLRYFQHLSNALEALVVAVNIYCPLEDRSADRLERLNVKFSELRSKESLAVDDAEALASIVKWPGSRIRTEHALRVVLGYDPTKCNENLAHIPKIVRLRNQLAHPALYPEADHSLRPFEDQARNLKRIVWELAGFLLGTHTLISGVGYVPQQRPGLPCGNRE